MQATAQMKAMLSTELVAELVAAPAAVGNFGAAVCAARALPPPAAAARFAELVAELVVELVVEHLVLELVAAAAEFETAVSAARS